MLLISFVRASYSSHQKYIQQDSASRSDSGFSPATDKTFFAGPFLLTSAIKLNSCRYTHLILLPLLPSGDSRECSKRQFWLRFRVTRRPFCHKKIVYSSGGAARACGELTGGDSGFGAIASNATIRFPKSDWLAAVLRFPDMTASRRPNPTHDISPHVIGLCESKNIRLMSSMNL